MAPRSTHFGKDRMFSEYNEKRVNEYLPWGLPFTGMSFSTHTESPFPLPAMVLRSEPTDHLEKKSIDFLLQRWNLFVDYYSQTDLTYPEKDKLMAICAIAKRFGRVMPGPYTAGIFLSSNQSGLLWNNAYRAKYSRRNEGSWWKKIELDNKRDSVYRAPSW
jgi:hypothetical protein